MFTSKLIIASCAAMVAMGSRLEQKPTAAEESFFMPPEQTEYNPAPYENWLDGFCDTKYNE